MENSKRSGRDGVPRSRRAVPEFSVVIPTYNRTAQLQSCLAALAQNDPPGGFEVVVVDDGGISQPDTVVASWRDRLDISLLRQANGGPAAARNFGAAHSRGRLLAFTDDDCRPTREWLAALGRAADPNPDCAVGGHTENGNRASKCCTASHAILDSVYRHYNLVRGNARFLLTSNLMVPAASFHSIGGFNSRFRTAEDREFCHRWLAAGRRIIYVPEAVVCHYGRAGLTGFLGQHYRYGNGSYLYHRRQAARGSGTFEPWNFYAQMLASPLRNEKVPRSLALAGLVILSQVASACGYVAAGLRAGIAD